MKLAIIADDLTGALDAAAPFASRGLRTVAAVKPELTGEGRKAEPEILAINTASREIGAEEAGQRVTQVLALLPPDVAIFKKVDSRLKGHVAQELAAFGARRLLVVPAIPEFDRIVAGGAVTGFGVERPIMVRERLGEAAARSVVPDVKTAADMDAAIAGAEAGAVIVGARGAASALARQMSGSPGRAMDGLGGTLVLAIGSRDPITLAQIAAFRAAYPRAVHDQAPLGVSARTEPPAHDGQPVLVQAVAGEADAPPEAVAVALARSLKRLYLQSCDGLLISGGATAETVLEEMGIGMVEVLGEIMEGLPVSAAGALTIISKSGGFGKPGTLVEIVRRFGGAD